MKKINKTNIKIINNGKNISNSIQKINEKDSRKKTILIYFIPLTALVIIGFIYIFTHINVLLIPFAVLMFIVLFGWDSATRICPNCKSWNAAVWIKNENVSETEEKKEKSKNKNKKIKVKYTIIQGKCKNCGCVFEKKKQRIF
jgi:hypothetical protein